MCWCPSISLANSTWFKTRCWFWLGKQVCKMFFRMTIDYTMERWRQNGVIWWHLSFGNEGSVSYNWTENGELVLFIVYTKNWKQAITQSKYSDVYTILYMCVLKICNPDILLLGCSVLWILSLLSWAFDYGTSSLRQKCGSYEVSGVLMSNSLMHLCISSHFSVLLVVG